MAGRDEGGAKPQIAIARSEAEKQAIYRFRFRIFVDELKQTIADADYGKKLVFDGLDETAVHLYMTAKGRIIAAIRLNLGKLTPVPSHLYQAYVLDRFTAFPAEQISFTGHLAIDPQWQAGSVPAVLLGATYKLARQQGIRFDFCHCAPSFVGLYEHLGYRRYADNFVDRTAGYQVPLVLLSEDVDHLKQSGSPFYKLALQYKNTAKTTVWFSREFPEAASGSSGARMSDEDFWKMLTQKLQQIPLVSIPLLKGLEYDQAKRFLNVGTVLKIKAGDAIVRRGDIGNEMFVVLAGAVEVRGDFGNGEVVLANLGQGDVFGELAFLTEQPRTANVVAVSDTEVMVLTQKFFEQVMDKLPAITSKVLFNLCLILCERLKTSTDKWMQAVSDGKEAATGEQKLAS